MLPITVRRNRGIDEPFDWSGRDFDRFFRRLREEGLQDSEIGIYPVDINEEEDAYIVEAEIPGFTKDEINLTIENNVLRLQAERKANESRGTRHLNERRFRKIDRAFTLPEPVDETQVEATLTDGVLRLRIPKSAVGKAKRIEIK